MKSLDLSSFERPDTIRWYQEAKKQLKGKDVLDKLSWQSLGISHLKPYYDQADIVDLAGQISFFESLPHHAWELYERIEVKDSEKANAEALQALMGGCNGIIFENSGGSDLQQLLKGIDLAICTISTEASVEGATGMNAHNCVSISEDLNPVNQIKNILGKINNSHSWIRRRAFPDFFIEIATVRALRFLLNQEKAGHEIKIHSSVPFHPTEEHQWFLNTTAGLASILGGSFSIDLTTAMGDNRISRNVGNILREESGIDKYEDQCGGSFFVETVTSTIIQEVSK